MKKSIALVLCLVIMATVFVGCSKEANNPQEVNNDNAEENVEVITVKVIVPDGLPALSIAKLMKEKPAINENVIIEYEIAKTPDVLASKVLSGEADIAVVPSNLAAQAYNKNMPYKLAATAGWGSFYMVTTEDIKEWEDLKGREIYSIGRGMTPDIVLRYLLDSNNLHPENDVNINYLNAATELAPAFISGKSNLAVMPEPMLSTVLEKKSNASIIFDFNQEWKNATGSLLGFPQSSIIIKPELVEDRKDFLKEFLNEYENSISWANSNPSNLADYAEELEISVSKAVIVSSIERANLRFIHIKDSIKEYKDYFQTLLDFQPQSIGGKLPDEGLYMEK